MKRIIDGCKNILFSLIPVLILVLVIEVAACVIYFHKKSGYPTGLAKVYESALLHYGKYRVESSIKLSEEDRGKIFKLYKTDPKLNDYLRSRYEIQFSRMVNATKANNQKLIALYLPPLLEESHELDFYGYLAQKYGVPFVDGGNVLKKYPAEEITFLPDDEHYTRFGNIVLADYIGRFLSTYSEFRTSKKFDSIPEVLGNLPPGSISLKSESSMPYLVNANAQGFRMMSDLAVPKRKQRVLVLGASLVFGPFVNTQDTFPAMLGKKYGLEVLNAGQPSSNLEERVDMYNNKAKYSEPDIVLLQMADIGIYWNIFYINNVYYYKRGLVDDERIQPSSVEIDFMKKHNVHWN